MVLSLNPQEYHSQQSRHCITSGMSLFSRTATLWNSCWSIHRGRRRRGRRDGFRWFSSWCLVWWSCRSRHRIRWECRCLCYVQGTSGTRPGQIESSTGWLEQLKRFWCIKVAGKCADISCRQQFVVLDKRRVRVVDGNWRNSHFVVLKTASSDRNWAARLNQKAFLGALCLGSREKMTYIKWISLSIEILKFIFKTKNKHTCLQRQNLLN